MSRAIETLGWWLMGIPWRTTESLDRSFERRDWHARLYFLGMKLANWRMP